MDIIRRLLSGRYTFIDLSPKFDKAPGYFYFGLLIVVLLVGGLWASPELRDELRDEWRKWRGKTPVVTEIQKLPPTTKPQMQAPPPTAPRAGPEKKVEPEPPKKTDTTQRHKDTRVYGAIKRGPWEVWKEVEYGTLYTNATSAIKALGAATVDSTAGANKTLRRLMKKNVLPHSISVVKVTVADLGFTDPPRLLDIIAAAKKRGLLEIPIDAVPAIALEYSGERTLFFGTLILSGENENKSALAVSDSKYEEERALLRTVEQRGWDDSYLSLTFQPAAIFLFALPD